MTARHLCRWAAMQHPDTEIRAVEVDGHIVLGTTGKLVDLPPSQRPAAEALDEEEAKRKRDLVRHGEA